MDAQPRTAPELFRAALVVCRSSAVPLAVIAAIAGLPELARQLFKPVIGETPLAYSILGLADFVAGVLSVAVAAIVIHCSEQGTLASVGSIANIIVESAKPLTVVTVKYGFLALAVALGGFIVMVAIVGAANAIGWMLDIKDPGTARILSIVILSFPLGLVSLAYSVASINIVLGPPHAYTSLDGSTVLRDLDRHIALVALYYIGISHIPIIAGLLLRLLHNNVTQTFLEALVNIPATMLLYALVVVFYFEMQARLTSAHPHAQAGAASPS